MLEQARLETFLDWFVFIPVYVLILGIGTLAAGIALSWQGSKGFARAGRYAALAVVAAGVFDVIENFFLLYMIDQHLSGASVGRAFPLGSAIFAWPKLVVLLSSMAFVFIGLLSWPVQTIRRTRDRHGAR